MKCLKQIFKGNFNFLEESRPALAAVLTYFDMPRKVILLQLKSSKKTFLEVPCKNLRRP